ncbi:BspA family leucine-rich repeat surface protein [Mycoplasma mycoides subsp. capri]|uniref:BspA family leucine-rich repeat surface protein n=1 Tax=Mycoplasma mycoides TaxID=2102 RepID=UPI00223ECF69|nr:BspA family leucine-rich repeat surface protein [Mycoplasma mycoides]UZK64456.1 BspA family leucine-rich repeat surface protein [Mycoplasma mycoides subsp. capri]
MKKLLTILGVGSFFFIGFTGLVLSNVYNNSNKYEVYYKQLKSKDHKIDDKGRLIEIGYTVSSNGVVRIKNLNYKVKKIAAKLPDELNSLKGAFQVNPNNIEWEVDWDTKNITDMSYMFYNTKWFNSEKISKWNTSNVTNMEGMFGLAKEFNQDISEWDVSKVTNFKDMFYGTEKFNNKNEPLKWNSKLKNAKNLQGMFRSSNSFNQDISEWDVSNVEDMSRMFEKASSFNNGKKPLDWGHKLKNIKNMSNMFNGASKFTHDLSSWLMNDIVKNDNFGLNKENQPKWKVEVPKLIDEPLKSNITPNNSTLPGDAPGNSENQVSPKKPEDSEINNETIEKNENSKEDKIENPKIDDNLYKIPSTKPNTIIKSNSPNIAVITGAVLGTFTVLGIVGGTGYYYRKNLKNFYLNSANKTKNLYFKSKEKIKDKLSKIKSKK